LRKTGLALNELIESAYDLGAGRDAMKQLMSAPAERRATAVFCGNDVLAIGAVLEAQSMGLDVPSDVSIVGFDNLPLAEHLRPGLTTVHVPSRRMGHAAADFVLNAIKGKHEQTSIALPTNLIVRGTTAAPKDL